MKLISKLAISIFIGLGLIAQLSAAPRIETYTPEKFSQAQKNNETIFLDFKASWCPTCRKQGRILERLSPRPKYDDFRFFEVDYDKAKALLKKYHVTRQSTFILLKGHNEIDRLVAATSEKRIEDFLDQGVRPTRIVRSFDQKAFQRAKESGKTVLLHFYGPEATSKRQSETLSKMALTGLLGDTLVFKIDHPHSKKLRKLFNVPRQSTLIVFKQNKEITRAEGVARPKEIRSLLGLN